MVSGEYNHGKSTTAMILTKWDTIYTRELLHYFHDPREEEAAKHLKFSIKNSVIISPKDPASRFIAKPHLLRPYEVDEGYLWATTQEAGEKKVAKLRDYIMQNRKKSPSMYWVYPNLFKIPSILLENMLEVVHMSSVGHGIMIAPSTVIQLKEKFDKKKIEKYAHKPRYFTNSMQWHSGFIFYPNFPRMKGKVWDKYLAKYERYKVITDDGKDAKKQESAKVKFFEELDKLIEKGAITVEHRTDVARYIKDALEKQNNGRPISEGLPNILATEYGDWKLEKMSEKLLKGLNAASMKNKLDIDEEDKDEL